VTVEALRTCTVDHQHEALDSCCILFSAQRNFGPKEQRVIRSEQGVEDWNVRFLTIVTCFFAGAICRKDVSKA